MILLSIAALRNTDLVLTSMGDITVNDTVTSGAGLLTFNAAKDININQNIKAPDGGLRLIAINNISAAAEVNVGTFILSKGTWNQVGTGTLPSFAAHDFHIAGGTFIRCWAAMAVVPTPITVNYRCLWIAGYRLVNCYAELVF